MCATPNVLTAMNNNYLGDPAVSPKSSSGGWLATLPVKVQGRHKHGLTRSRPSYRQTTRRCRRHRIS